MRRKLANAVIDQLLEALEVHDIETLPLSHIREQLAVGGLSTEMPSSLKALISQAIEEERNAPQFGVNTERIPKKLHVIWVGKEHERPTECINSWKDSHPDWQFRIWTEEDLDRRFWRTIKQMRILLEAKCWAGVADMMKYEILFQEGGVYVDADSYCLKPLDTWILNNKMFACWEDGIAHAKFVGTSFIGSIPNNPFLNFVIDRICSRTALLSRLGSYAVPLARLIRGKVAGPPYLTDCIKSYDYSGYKDISIFASHIFAPMRDGSAASDRWRATYAVHTLASTKKLYWTQSEIDDQMRFLLLDLKGPQPVPGKSGAAGIADSWEPPRPAADGGEANVGKVVESWHRAAQFFRRKFSRRGLEDRGFVEQGEAISLLVNDGDIGREARDGRRKEAREPEESIQLHNVICAVQKRQQEIALSLASIGSGASPECLRNQAMAVLASQRVRLVASARRMALELSRSGVSP
jgi:hypothetical protein